MRIGLGINYAGGFKEVAAEVADLERAGLDIVFVPEAYSFDAVSALGYLAASTERVELASGILQLYTRTPTLTAMTAAGLDYVSDGRFILGLGASGPQVIEGFHGVPYDAPIARTREVIDICRQVWRRETVEHQGKHYTIPLPAEQGTGLGKPLKLINKPVRERIPILIAALGPKNVELAAEIAEGWQPIFYLPEKAQDVWGEALASRPGQARPRVGGARCVSPDRHWPSAKTSSRYSNSSNRTWRSTSAAWAPRARTSITPWPPGTATALRPTASKSFIWPATRTAPPRLCPTNSCEMSR